jgi:hypothetical protein
MRGRRERSIWKEEIEKRGRGVIEWREGRTLSLWNIWGRAGSKGCAFVSIGDA